ncbi:glycosyl transferase family 90 [Marinobacter sp.]|uniref:glycosyl transferase family 90 n=1 Tax=Marinobacter sp. TaxID=50741 RepID=UPI00384D0F6D
MKYRKTSSRGLHKICFYARNALLSMIPPLVWRQRGRRLLAEFARMSPDQQANIQARVNYYNQLEHRFPLPATAEPIEDFSSKGKSSAYSCDFRNHARYFPGHLKLSYLFGDVTEVPAEARMLKSRPITGDSSNRNSVILKLNTVRHYHFVPDPLAFREKKPMAVWRGKSNQPHRIEFARQYADHPLCNVGCTVHKEPQALGYHRDFLSVEEQLKYQFVVSLEGIDVATNLKWIMASNSLCLMRRPRFETWFMEGTLIPGYHYVELKDDYSDLVEKTEYYRENPEKAEAIVRNANHHASRFMDAKMEELVSILVVDKYLRLSGQGSPRRSMPATYPAKIPTS